MSRRIKKAFPIAVKWLSEVVVDPNCLSNSFQHYKKFQFENIVAEIGDYVLISNADAAEPDTEDGCDAARIVSLYEDSTNQKDPFRAKVQWYSKPTDLPAWCFNNTEHIDFLDKELLEDHRPFNADVSIQTFFKKCSVTFKSTKDTDHTTRAPYNYICRYRVMSVSKRKVLIEPVIDEERKELQLLSTPAKSMLSPRNAKTPTSLVKRMGRVSLSEQKDKNWSISKAEGTKLLLKRAILSDKTEKETPSSRTPRSSASESPKSAKKLNKKNLAEILSMELQENSEDELPTLIIRQNNAATSNRRQSVYVSKTNEETPRRQSVSVSKRKQSVCVSKINEETPKNTLFYEKEKSPYTTKSGRTTKSKTNYVEEEVSPVKQHPRRSRKFSEAVEVSGPAQKKTVPLEDATFKLTFRRAQIITDSDDENQLVPKTQSLTKTKQTVSMYNDGRRDQNKINEETPKKTLEREKSPYTTRSGRTTKTKINYIEQELSPVKRTARRTRTFSEVANEPAQSMSEMRLEDISSQDTVKPIMRRARKLTESDDELKPAPKSSKIPKTPQKTPKETVSRKILSQTTPTLRTRAQSIENIDDKREQNKTNEDTPRKLFEKEKSLYTTRSGRASKTKINYIEQELSPVKRTPRKTRAFSTAECAEPYETTQRISVLSLEDISPQDTAKPILRRARKLTESDDELKPAPKSSKIPKTPQKTPKETVSRKILSQITPTLRTRAQSIENIDDKREQNKTNEHTPRKLFEKEKSPYTTRSGRATKTKINYVEEELSPVKRTSRKTRAFSKAECEEAYEPTRRISMSLEDLSPQDTAKQTPIRSRTPKIPKTPKASAQTPKQRVSRKMISQMTPTLHSRAHSVDNIDELMRENNSLPGRESQMDEILGFVRAKLLDGSSGCMYISGMPGTGKTATVCSALKTLKNEVDLPEFQLVEVNGMRMAEPRQAYVQIYKQLTGKSVVWEQACALLEKRFTNPSPRRMPTVLVVDELDALCTRRQDVLYSIMEWAAHNTAVLTVLAIANTMDLPERALAARVASRLGLTRLTFPPYTHAQLQRIVATRLDGTNVSADAVQLIARKVAAVSGDARRALALCRRALVLSGPAGAGLDEVQRALGEASSGAAVESVRLASGVEKLVMRAVAAEVERTGSEETTLSRVLSAAAAIVASEGRPYKSATHIRAPTPSQTLAACQRLAAYKLLLLEPKPSEPRIILNISVDDVYYATRRNKA